MRAVYLLTAAADLVRVQPDAVDEKFKSAIYRLWRNMVERKMYVTGGIGAMKRWEGFGRDYFLPQGTDDGGCYAETCAAIGVMMMAERLLQVSTQRCNPPLDTRADCDRSISMGALLISWNCACTMPCLPQCPTTESSLPTSIS